VSQSGEPCIGESEDCELKSWRENWCSNSSPH